MAEERLPAEREDLAVSADAFKDVGGEVEQFDVLPEDMELPQIGWAGGGATNFVQDDDPIKEFEAIIMAQWKQRAWYKTTFEEGGGGDFPDCYSYDMVRPAPDVEAENRQCETCTECPMAAFGSHPNGRGKWCSERLNILGLVKNEKIPTRILVPVTSHKPFGKYITRCMRDGLNPRGMFTKFKLRGDTSRSGFKIAVLECEPTTLIAPRDKLVEAIKRIEGITDKILPGLRQSVTVRPQAEDDNVPY